MEFRYGEIISVSWEKTKKNFGIILLMLIGSFIVLMAFSFIANTFEKQGAIGIVAALVSYAVQMFITIGLIRCFLQMTDDQKVDLSDLFSGGDVLFRFVIVNILYTLLCVLGYLLLIVPGIIWSIKYSFVPFFVVDKNIDIKESFKRSGEITNGYKWKIFGLMCLISLINIGGCLLLGVGLIVTIPLTCVISPVVYRLLCGELIKPKSIS